MPAPAELLNYTDAHTDAFIARLTEAVAIPSISGDPPAVQLLQKSEWLNGGRHHAARRTRHAPHGGQTLLLPNAIEDRLALYGHFDVQRRAGFAGAPIVLRAEKRTKESIFPASSCSSSLSCPRRLIFTPSFLHAP
ncbi:hypothetical protein B0H17DRAFT_1187459 [Mycena rosella]|uniref:Uncharacterized protein n=1 Tax=Mycena rosella TaxID=1033263 RepID=A0AAD7FPF3_MYCRO|nr:hypothetical protein B0H17DRAFT_1187459 [Mycena rosella]